MAAAGHGAAVFYHFMYETTLPMDGLPGAEQWVAAYADVPEDERHLAIHDQHLVAVNDHDRPLITPDVLTAMGAVFTPDELRARLAGLAEAGMTEMAYQPAGPDIHARAGGVRRGRQRLTTGRPRLAWLAAAVTDLSWSRTRP